MNSKIRAIARRIKEHNAIVIGRHVGPDPDAIASQIALRDAIKLRFPSKEVYAVGAPVAKFKSYGELDKIDVKKLENPLLIVLDCPNISRVDIEEFDYFKDVIKIDHHPFEDKMGEIEWVDVSASSTCEMITEFLISARYRANKSIAENLFIGVVADSDRFLLSSTSAKTLELMAVLIKNSHIDTSAVYSRLYLRPLNEVKFQAYITEHLNVTKNGFASLKTDKNIIEKYEVDAGTASKLVNNFNNIEEILAWALVSYDEKLKLYKVNIRSRGPVINDVASKYNGGGHAKACGARIENPEDIDKLFADLDEACKEYKKSLKTSKIEEESDAKVSVVEIKEEKTEVEIPKDGVAKVEKIDEIKTVEKKSGPISRPKNNQPKSIKQPKKKNKKRKKNSKK